MISHILSISLRSAVFSALAVSILTVLWCIYAIFFHSLANVPGPLLLKITGWPSCIHAGRGDRHIWQFRLHQRYGPKVRIEPNAVIFCSPEAHRDIYSMRANVQKSHFYETYRRETHISNIFNCVERSEHAQRRRLTDAAFSDASARTMFPYMSKEINRWLELISSEKAGVWTKPQEFSALAKALVFDIMGELVLGQSFETKEPGENLMKGTPEMTTDFMRLWYPLARSPLRGLFLWLKPRGIDSILVKMAPAHVGKHFNDALAARAKLQEEQSTKPISERRLDLFHYLAEAKDPLTGGPALNQFEFLAMADNLVVAGLDTTTAALSAVFFYITQDEFRYSKLAQELRNTFASVDEVTPTTVAQCTYLRAVIDESIRISPPAPGEFSRDVLRGGMTIDGTHFPAGVTVGVDTFALNHSQVTYGDAEVWRPERWIATEGTKEEVARLREGFSPFKSGLASCPGQSVATMNLRLTTARTLLMFDVRRAPGKDGEIGSRQPVNQTGEQDLPQFQVGDAYTGFCSGPMVQFKRRGV